MIDGADDLALSYRTLAQAIEPDLAEVELDDGRWLVSDVKGLEVVGETRLGAWTRAYDAVRSRRDWRLRTAERRR